MNVFSFLSMLNIGMTAILVVLASYRLGLSTDAWRRQIVATTIFLSIALLVISAAAEITMPPIQPFSTGPMVCHWVER